MPSQPRSLLYSIAAGIGGTGLDQVAAETLEIAIQRDFLGRAIAYSPTIRDPKSRIRNLSRHPVKLLSPLSRDYYVGAKKHTVDRATVRELATGRHDLLHTWSGDCVRSLRLARELGIPSVLEIPTWHRNKGKVKKDITWSEIQRDAARFPQSVLNRLLVTRQRVMEEYSLATLILVLSEKAKETFLIAGLPDEKLFLTSRGVDPEAFAPAENPPDKFRAVFVGSLSKRKGAHHLLEAWKRLALPVDEAELVLVGSPSAELAPALAEVPPNVILRGQVKDVAAELRRATLHVFPSECEGSAKVTYEASACGLPQITTREAGDVVIHEQTGLIIPPNDVDALIDALRTLHADPVRAQAFGHAARQRVVENFTWDHYRQRVLAAYDQALARSSELRVES
ncbi:MAG: glycosyltransferase family 4 protein [Chthoniobacterales bacterium]